MQPLLNCETNNDILEAALGYVDRGWAVLPLAPGGKEPFAPLLPKIKGKPTWKPLAARPSTKKEISKLVCQVSRYQYRHYYRNGLRVGGC